ncbi:hypothetical protein JTB14_024289 [Gonioctena quinquepunctata]|nr:hypothetical protein JTB14_024289 [Gonioctena quinquepunctata]
MRQEFMWRKQKLYSTLSWMIDIIDGKNKNCMDESEEYRREFKVQNDLSKGSLPEQWGNFREKFPDIKGYEKFERGSEYYGKYENYETEKREDKDKSSKPITNSGGTVKKGSEFEEPENYKFVLQ